MLLCVWDPGTAGKHGYLNENRVIKAILQRIYCTGFNFLQFFLVTFYYIKIRIVLKPFLAILRK